MGTKNFLVWLFVYVLAMTIVLYIYKYYSAKKLELAEADQQFLFKYITDNHPDVTIKMYDCNGDMEVYDSVDIEEDETIEQSQEGKEEKENEVQNESRKQPDSSEEKVQQENNSTGKLKYKKIPIKAIKKLAKKISEGKKINSVVDLQLQKTHPKEIETELKKLVEKVVKKSAIKPPPNSSK